MLESLIQELIAALKENTAARKSEMMPDERRRVEKAAVESPPVEPAADAPTPPKPPQKKAQAAEVPPVDSTVPPPPPKAMTKTELNAALTEEFKRLGTREPITKVFKSHGFIGLNDAKCTPDLYATLLAEVRAVPKGEAA